MDSELQSKSMEFLQSAVKGAMEDYEIEGPPAGDDEGLRENY